MLTQMEELRREKLIEDQAKKAAMSGFASGAVLNPMLEVLKSGANARKLALSALLGGTGFAAAAGGANYVGGKIMGPNHPHEWQPNTDRGMRGGAVGGGMMGGITGGVLSSPLITDSFRSKMADNLVMRQFGKFAGQPRGMSKGALLGAGIGALSGAFLGSDEGMQLDFIQDQIDMAQREKLLREQSRGPF